MAGNYEKSMYNQLMDVMSRQDSFEEKYKQGTAERTLSTGSIHQFCKALAGNAKRSIEHLEEELFNQRIVATDAAVITNNGVQCYIRIFSITGAVFGKTSREHESMTIRLRCIIIKKQKYAKSDKRSLRNRMDK